MLEGAISEEDRRKMMSWVSPQVVDAFATLYWEAHEFVDYDLLDWLDQQLIMSAARKGWRAGQVVEIQVGEQALKVSNSRHLDPSYDRPQPAQAENGQAGKRRGWGG